MSPASPPRIRAIRVDDEPAVRRGVRRLRERDGGVEIVGEAAGGGEAAELIRRDKPDLAFLDVQMPGGDGCGALGKLEPARTPAVVFVTADDELGAGLRGECDRLPVETV